MASVTRMKMASGDDLAHVHIDMLSSSLFRHAISLQIFFFSLYLSLMLIAWDGILNLNT